MITLTELSDLDSLPLSQPLKSFLNRHLIQLPFGTHENAQTSWNELENRLILFDPKDSVYSTSTIPPIDSHLATIKSLIDYPEYVLNAPDSYCLALFIIDQSGSGLYLLFPKPIHCPALTQLANRAEDV